MQSYSLRIIRRTSWAMGGKVTVLWIGKKGRLTFMQFDTGLVRGLFSGGYNNPIASSQTFITSLGSSPVLGTRHKHLSLHRKTLPARFVESDVTKISDHQVPLQQSKYHVSLKFGSLQNLCQGFRQQQMGGEIVLMTCRQSDQAGFVLTSQPVQYPNH